MTYTEFPADLIVNVHWKKKDKPPPDDGPWPPDGLTCGGFYAAAGLPGSAYIIMPIGIADAHFPNSVNFITPHGWPGIVDYYLWNNPSGGFTAELQAQLAVTEFDVGGNTCLGFGLDVGLNLIRNRDPRLVGGNDYNGGGPTTINFPGQILTGPNTETWPPIIVVGGGVTSEVVGGGFCNIQRAQMNSQLLIQAHCQHETFGGPPVTPTGPQPGVPPNLKYPWEVA